MANEQHVFTSPVAFIDILGFQSFISSAKPEQILAYMNIVPMSVKLSTKGNDSNYFSVVISDSIFISPLKSFSGDVNDSLKKLREFLVVVAKIQKNLSQYGLWARGGIGYGKLYIDRAKKQIVGKPVVEAYQIESTIAKYPRIVMTNSIVEALGLENSQELIHAINLIPGDKNDWETNVLLDWNYLNKFSNYQLEKDVPFVIDYFSYIEKSSPYFIELDLTLTTLNNSLAKTSYYEKHNWTRKYLINKVESLMNGKGIKGLEQLHLKLNEM